MIHTLILDLDDVLNTCTPALAELFGVKLHHPEDTSWHDPKYQWDIIGAVCNALGREERFGLEEFWDQVPSEFWATIPKSSICDRLIDTCVSLVGEDNITIATSPTKDKRSYGYKVDWIEQNLPKFMHRQFDITPRKERLSRHGTLLIDDCWDNCVKAGERHGDYICLPKPWNVNHFYYYEVGDGFYLTEALSIRDFTRS